MSTPVDNPLFARIWTTMAGHETEAVRRLRRENLGGLTGRRRGDLNPRPQAFFEQFYMCSHLV